MSLTIIANIRHAILDSDKVTYRSVFLTPDQAKNVRNGFYTVSEAKSLAELLGLYHNQNRRVGTAIVTANRKNFLGQHLAVGLMFDINNPKTEFEFSDLSDGTLEIRLEKAEIKD